MFNNNIHFHIANEKITAYYTQKQNRMNFTDTTSFDHSVKFFAFKFTYTKNMYLRYIV